MSQLKELKNRYALKQIKKTEDEKFNSYDFDRTMAKFVFDEPFYSSISCKLKKYKTKDFKTTTKIDTAAVTVKDGKFILIYNEEYFDNLIWRHRQGLLKHEFLHLVFHHITSRIKLLPDGNPDPIWYIACDYAINSLIPESDLPPNGLVPGKPSPITEKQRLTYSYEEIKALEKHNEMVKSWPKGESADWYYKQICKDRENFEKIMGGFELTDNHDGWGEVSDEEKDILENDLSNIIKEAEKETEKRGWGSVPKELQQMIKKMTSNAINWRALLKNFVGNSKAVHFSSTIKKISKRYAYIHPGKKRSRSARILIAIDESGSMDEKAISLFFGELDKLAEITEFVVVPFDSEIVKENIFTWRRGQKMPAERVACGGTDFNIPTNWANENSSNFDAIIFMTDGLCYKPVSCKIPRAWIICPGGKLFFETNELVIPMRNDS